jgi:5'-nucleotidase
MERKIRYLIVFLLILVAPFAFSQDLVILHTNDVHSNIEPLSSGPNAGLGGFQRRANYIKEMRDSHPNILLLDAGDYNQGTPYYTLFNGEMEVMLYNTMGYDAVCLGNHEFDDGQELLAKRLEKASYETLCANYDFKGTPLEGAVKPYTIIYKGGKKIGIIGVMLDLNGYVSKRAIEGLTYKNPVPIVNKLAKRLKSKEKCDLVIVLSHLGYKGSGKKRPGDIELAALTKNVDIIIGGHSHTFLEEPTIVKNSAGNGVIVNQTGAHGVYVGRIDINF